MRNKVTGKKLLTVSAGLFLGVIFLYLSWYSLGYTYYFTLQYDESMAEARDFLPLHLLTMVLVICLFLGVQWLAGHFHRHLKAAGWGSLPGLFCV